jgi:hypothetical protein
VSRSRGAQIFELETGGVICPMIHQFQLRAFVQASPYKSEVFQNQ